jgi:putative Ca2+/H+ antiporter (TMEM165/GDT1 family)
VDPKLFAAVFGTVFLAELGDKTQLATLLYAADVRNPKLTVFAAAAAALIATSALGILAGAFLAEHLNPKLITRIAGVSFVLIGVWTLLRA